jgi:hypothetical protein
MRWLRHWQFKWRGWRRQADREKKGETELVRVSFIFLTLFWVFTWIDDVACLWPFNYNEKPRFGELQALQYPRYCRRSQSSFLAP